MVEKERELRMEKAKFEDLRVYKLGLDLAKMIYKVTKEFPKEDIYGLTSQMRRATVSVPLNIAEGQGRGSLLENKQFLLIARGSLHEVLATLEIAEQEQYLSTQKKIQIRTEIFHLLRQLNSLIKYLKS